jgi:uncharacterized coiled-coil DUF342 family protein
MKQTIAALKEENECLHQKVDDDGNCDRQMYEMYEKADELCEQCDKLREERYTPNQQGASLKITVEVSEAENTKVTEELNKERDELHQQLATLSKTLEDSKTGKANIVPASSVKTPRECRHASRGNGSDTMTFPKKIKQERKRVRFTPEEDTCLRTGFDRY